MILNKGRIQGFKNVGEGLVPSRVFLTSGDHEGCPYVD